MNTFISGGCKNGKSYYAQNKAAEIARETGRPLYYIATMIPRDREDLARIARHISEREGWGFETVEQPVRIRELLSREDLDLGGAFLLDSVTAILENEMFPRQLKGSAGEEITCDMTAPERVRTELTALAKAVDAAGGSVVFVSDGIYGDMGEYSDSTEEYRKALAETDLALGAICHRVVEISYGTEEIWK